MGIRCLILVSTVLWGLALAAAVVLTDVRVDLLGVLMLMLGGAITATLAAVIRKAAGDVASGFELGYRARCEDEPKRGLHVVK